MSIRNKYRGRRLGCPPRPRPKPEETGQPPPGSCFDPADMVDTISIPVGPTPRGSYFDFDFDFDLAAPPENEND